MAHFEPSEPTRDGRNVELEQEFADFSYIVSHDLAASFRQINSFLELLTSDMDDSLTPAQRGYATHINSATAKCQLMLEQLLIYSRVQQAALEIEECDATLLVDSARLQLSQEVRESGADIVVGPLGRVRVDQTLMVQAFMGVLKNALQFTRPGTAPRVEIKAVMADGRWVCRVSDNGVGIAPDQHEKVFRMFYRLNPETAQGGIGSGLSIARRILRRHGGDVGLGAPASGSEAMGACVEISLPGAACASEPGA
jgi:light-regulated signal transduction histidine kinase (bacteriophytochrome)